MIKIDEKKFEVRVSKKVVKLEPKQYDLLLTLVKARGDVLTREDLYERVYFQESPSDGALRVIDQHLSRLRKRLGLGARHVVTVPTRGYRYV